MTKKQLDQLVEYSYEERSLDQETVMGIAKHLSREDLKKYIKALKRQDSQQTVYVTEAFSSPEKTRKMLTDLFPEKTVMYDTDRKLLLGTRIVTDDVVFELSLKNTLDKLVEHVGNSYEQ